MFVFTEIFGLVSTALMLMSRAVYFNSIFKGQTKPHAFSWLIWGVISSIGFAAQVAEGAGAGSWARGVSAATCFMLVILALMRGERYIAKSDWVTLAVAFMAIPLWIATKTPFWSVLLVVIIDNIGYIPTIRKSWMKPYEEKALSYFISGACAFFSLLAIEHYTPSTWLYPLVLTFSNTGMGSLLLIRRLVLRQHTIITAG